jgi:hypothetical protein
VLLFLPKDQMERGLQLTCREGRAICGKRQQDFFGRIDDLLADLMISLNPTLF